mgnify:CR=1 FL=1
MNRINQIFERKENLLSIYFTAGFPKIDDTLKIIKELDKSQVDMIEIGLPFSDPLADGPTIQKSSEKALKNGMTTDLLFDQLKGLRSITDIPIVLMGYFNPILQYGFDKFCINCKKSGIDGLIIPDLPVDIYKKSYKSLKENATGAYGGLGVEVVGEKGAIRVIAPIDGGPASENDIRSGDLIVELDKSPVSKMNIQKAIDKLRGEKGTEIELTILRDGEDRTITKTLIRDTIQISSVRGKLLYENFGYIRIAQFQISSDKDFVDEYLKLEELNKKELDGLVLDLRNNPGGLVPPSISIADMLLTSGKIVYTEGRLPNSNQEYYADPFDISGGIPIIILINGGSASASEIVAGALQDNRRAVVIGTQSFGKGSVQTVVPINENSAIKLTTAKYFTPDGRSIQALGISPDIVIELSLIHI